MHDCNAVKWQFVDIAAICQFAPFTLFLTPLYAFIIRRLSHRDVIIKGDDKTGFYNDAQKTRNAVARMFTLVINGIEFFWRAPTGDRSLALEFAVHNLLLYNYVQGFPHRCDSRGFY